MLLSRRALGSVLALFVLLLAGTFALPVQGEDEPLDPLAGKKALQASIARGRTLFQKVWVEGGKSCQNCHSQGPNRMRATRLKVYPKYDIGQKKVITGQQKLNLMLEHQGKGRALPLGSEDLTALEAFISTLR